MSTIFTCDMCSVQLRDNEFGTICEKCLYDDPEQPIINEEDINQEIIEKYPPIKIESYIDTSQYIIFQNTYLEKMLSHAIKQINLDPNYTNAFIDLEKQSEKTSSEEEESGDDKC